MSKTAYYVSTPQEYGKLRHDWMGNARRPASILVSTGRRVSTRVECALKTKVLMRVKTGGSKSATWT